MLLDFLSNSSYARYNIKLAGLLGLEASVYLEQLIEQYRKDAGQNNLCVIDDELDSLFGEQLNKSLKDKVGTHANIDRGLVESRTSIDRASQIKLDKRLSELGLINKPSENSHLVYVDAQAIVGLLLEDNESIKKEVSLVAKSKGGKPTKKDYAINAMKNKVYDRYKNNPQVRDVVINYIDSIFQTDKSRYLTAQALDVFLDDIDKFVGGNTSAEVEIFKRLISNPHCKSEWAIYEYKRIHGIHGNSANTSLGNNNNSIGSDDF